MTADNLKREFLPRFFGLARKRVERGREVARAPTAESCDALAREMHALAGEAGLLGLEAVLGAARQAELAAADLVKRPADTSSRDRLDHALGELEDAVRTSEKPAPPRPPPVQSLQDKFRARFVEAATTRRERIVRVMEAPEPDFVAACSEFHTLGGEAAMLAMTAIAAVCRDGEDAARRKDRATVAAVLEQLEIAIFAEETP
jgi:HPt (histidine-containing phosphotransfer) domain-containing protein